MGNPVEVVNVGDLAVLFGDSTGHGAGRTGYCGIWALTSAHDPHNAFVSSYAGAIFNSHRGAEVALRRLASDSVEFRLDQNPSAPRVVYVVRPPHYIDAEIFVTPQSRVEPYLMQSGASYINSPEDGDIHFRHAGKWVRGHSPKHGVDATYAPATLADTEDDLRHLSADDRAKNFVYGYSPQRFAEPFYFGRIRGMALAFLFDQASDIRFTISPSGGGGSILPGKSCPAWDWLWLIPRPAPGRTCRLKIRMVYKPFTTPDDLYEEYRRWKP